MDLLEESETADIFSIVISSQRKRQQSESKSDNGKEDAVSGFSSKVDTSCSIPTLSTTSDSASEKIDPSILSEMTDELFTLSRKTPENDPKKKNAELMRLAIRPFFSSLLSRIRTLDCIRQLRQRHANIRLAPLKPFFSSYFSRLGTLEAALAVRSTRKQSSSEKAKKVALRGIFEPTTYHQHLQYLRQIENLS